MNIPWFWEANFPLRLESLRARCCFCVCLTHGKNEVVSRWMQLSSSTFSCSWLEKWWWLMVCLLVCVSGWQMQNGGGVIFVASEQREIFSNISRKLKAKYHHPLQKLHFNLDRISIKSCFLFHWLLSSKKTKEVVKMSSLIVKKN